MRVFKREFSEELTEGMKDYECIITKLNRGEFGEFIVYQKDLNGNFPYVGVFPNLSSAITLVQKLEEPKLKYEYYLQSQAEYDNELGLMGELGWELCGIDSNIVDENGYSLYIYKRIIPPGIKKSDFLKLVEL